MMIPIYVTALLRSIRLNRGAAPPGYLGGRTFHNREQTLPPGRYHEFDVHPYVPGTDRGPERLVIDLTTGVAFYTSDHYISFEVVNG